MFKKKKRKKAPTPCFVHLHFERHNQKFLVTVYLKTDECYTWLSSFTMIDYFDDFVVVVTVLASIHQTHLLFPSKWDWKNLTETGVWDRDPTTSYTKQQVTVTVATFCVWGSMEKVLSSMLNIHWHCEGLCEQRAKNNHQHGWSMTVWDLQDATTT